MVVVDVGLKVLLKELSARVNSCLRLYWVVSCKSRPLVEPIATDAA